MDEKSRFHLKNNAICAVNGHSIDLPELAILEYNETGKGNKRFLVHETYMKCLPSILKDGLSRMSRNNIHFSMQIGRAGLQRKQKPNIAIYVDVTLAKRHGLRFLHCSNDVIMCPGDKRGFISSFFFYEIRKTTTGELISFLKQPQPRIEESSNEVVEEIELSRPARATGFEKDHKVNCHITPVRRHSTPSPHNIDSTGIGLQNQLLKVYQKADDGLKVEEYIRIAREWNSSPTTSQNSEEDTVYNECRLLESGTRRTGDSGPHHTQTPEVYRIAIGTPEQREELDSRWVNVGNIKDPKVRECAYSLIRGEWDDIMTQQAIPCQDYTDTGGVQAVQSPTKYNSYLGQHYVMPNGLRILIRQGDLVDETTDVIVNPANSELMHGGGAAKTISTAAGRALEEECQTYRQRFGDLQVGQVVHTTAGRLRPIIKYVLHAVGPHSGEANRQDCFTQVQRTILKCLEYTENTLEAGSLAIPAISSGMFGVPRVDVAQAMYLAVLKFDQTRPQHVKEVRIVNIDLETTKAMDNEFKWWFGQTPHISDHFQEPFDSKDLQIPLLFINQYDEGETTDSGVTEVITSTDKEDIFMVRRKSVDYVPERFTYFWRKESPFSQHFRCQFTIDGNTYSCAEQWMMEQKSLCFGRM